MKVSRGGNVTKEGNPRLLLGKENKLMIWETSALFSNWGLVYLLLSISGAQVCGNRSGPGLGAVPGLWGVDSGLLGEGVGPWMCCLPLLDPCAGG